MLLLYRGRGLVINTRLKTTMETRSQFTAFLVMKTTAKASLLPLALPLQKVTPPISSVCDTLESNAKGKVKGPQKFSIPKHIPKAFVKHFPKIHKVKDK